MLKYNFLEIVEIQISIKCWIEVPRAIFQNQLKLKNNIIFLILTA